MARPNYRIPYRKIRLNRHKKLTKCISVFIKYIKKMFNIFYSP